jgi:hypothetical protein
MCRTPGTGGFRGPWRDEVALTMRSGVRDAKRRVGESLSYGIPQRPASAPLGYSVIRDRMAGSASQVAEILPRFQGARTTFTDSGSATIIWRSSHHIRRDDATAAPFPGVVVGLRKFPQTISEA